MIRIFRLVIERWFVNNGPAAAAAVAFYALFSLAPTLVFAIALASPILGDEDTYQAVVTWVSQIIDPPLARSLVESVRNTSFDRHGILPTIAAGLILLWGASATFVQIRITLNRLLGATAGSIREQIRLTIIGHLMAAGFAIGTGIVLLSGIVSSALISHAARQSGASSEIVTGTTRILSTVQSWLIVATMFTVLMKVLPVKTPSWRIALLGAGLATILFELGKYIMGLYLSRSVIASVYGPFGAIVAIIVWIYYSSQTFLIGAELMAVLENERAHDLHPLGGEEEDDPIHAIQ